jgi:uncharacterized membrane protein YccC
MKKILGCRRTSLAFFAIMCLTGLGVHLGQDISGIAVAIAGIVASVAGSNAFEKSRTQPPKEDI